MIPDVHLARQGSDLDDCLTQEVVTLPGQLLPQPRLQVVVLVPDPHLDPVTRVVTLTKMKHLKFEYLILTLTMRISHSTPG